MLSDLQTQDFEWYKEHLAELFAQYDYGVVAIKRQTVLGVYNTEAEAVRKTQKSEELGTFIVQKLGPDESAYTGYIY